MNRMQGQFVLVEGHLNCKVFAQMLGRLAALPVPGG